MSGLASKASCEGARHRYMPAASDASSNPWSEAFDSSPWCETAVHTAAHVDRLTGISIPSLDLATIPQSSDFKHSSEIQDPQKFDKAFDALTHALVLQAHALETSETGASSMMSLSDDGGSNHEANAGTIASDATTGLWRKDVDAFNLYVDGSCGEAEPRDLEKKLREELGAIVSVEDDLDKLALQVRVHAGRTIVQISGPAPAIRSLHRSLLFRGAGGHDVLPTSGICPTQQFVQADESSMPSSACTCAFSQVSQFDSSKLFSDLSPAAPKDMQNGFEGICQLRDCGEDQLTDYIHETLTVLTNKIFEPPSPKCELGQWQQTCSPQPGESIMTSISTRSSGYCDASVEEESAATSVACISSRSCSIVQVTAADCARDDSEASLLSDLCANIFAEVPKS